MATEDGSVGAKGNVLDAMKEYKHRRNSDSSADQESFLSRLHGKSVSKRSQYPDRIARF